MGRYMLRDWIESKESTALQLIAIHLVVVEMCQSGPK